MEAFAKAIEALSGFAWPALILFAGFYFREQIQSLFQLARQQIASGAALKWKDFEFKGLDLASFDAWEGTGYCQEPADKSLFDKRHESYRINKNLFLVHRVRPTGQSHAITGLPTYDVSVYLIPHKNFGHLNDVREVQYYFGQHFGLNQSEYGTKFVVENGSDSFAVRVNAYGPTLCEARIVFHDGSETTVSRYLDFEGTDYRFRSETNRADAEKLKQRQEG
jgi:hypothetical protein